MVSKGDRRIQIFGFVSHLSLLSTTEADHDHNAATAKQWLCFKSKFFRTEFPDEYASLMLELAGAHSNLSDKQRVAVTTFAASNTSKPKVMSGSPEVQSQDSIAVTGSVGAGRQLDKLGGHVLDSFMDRMSDGQADVVNQLFSSDGRVQHDEPLGRGVLRGQATRGAD